MGITKMKPLMALSLATIFALGCSREAAKIAEMEKVSSEDFFKDKMGETDFSAEEGGGRGGGSSASRKEAARAGNSRGGRGGGSMEAMKEAARAGNSRGGGGGGGSMEAMKEAARAGNSGGGGGGGMSMEAMKEAARSGNSGGGGGGGMSMEAMKEAARSGNSGGGGGGMSMEEMKEAARGGGGAGSSQPRMSRKERAIQKAEALQKETQDVVEKFLAAVDDADQKKMSSMIGRRARGTLKRLRDGNISDKDFDRIVEMYQDGEVTESKKSRREWAVTVDLPGRSRRIKVKEESNNWKISGLDGLR